MAMKPNLKCIECSKSPKGTAKTRKCFKGRNCMKMLCYYRKHEHSKIKQRIVLYGVTLEQYEDMLKAQNNACACCGNAFEKTPNIDHNHKTGRVRGLLCSACNMALGMIGDSKDRAMQLIAYLGKQ